MQDSTKVDPKLIVVELKEILKSKGLSICGNKDELLNRFLSSDRKTNQTDNVNATANEDIENKARGGSEQANDNGDGRRFDSSTRKRDDQTK